MLYVFICEDEEVQLNYIKSMITEYIVVTVQITL